MFQGREASMCNLRALGRQEGHHPTIDVQPQWMMLRLLST